MSIRYVVNANSVFKWVRLLTVSTEYEYEYDHDLLSTPLNHAGLLHQRPLSRRGTAGCPEN